MEEIFKRRSIREYKDGEIDDEKVDKILRAGMQAPGSRLGKEPWEFIVVKNKETINRLSEMKPNGYRLKGASLAIVSLANMDRVHYPAVWQQDMSAAVTNMLLEVSYLGLGGVWLGVAPTKERMDFISEIFDLGENLRPFNIICIGYPAEGQENKFLDKFDKSRIHYEKY